MSTAPSRTEMLLQDRTPSAFLSLAPTTSASYPTVRSTTTTSVIVPVPQPEVSASAVSATAANRRSSSMSSEASIEKPHSFLRLGPVHHGVE